MAAHFLIEKGWRIIGQNLHFRFGEVDLLADSGDYIVVVEVKAKKSSSHGFAVEMITREKQHTLIRLAKLMQTQYNKPVRVDVVAIDNFLGATPTITHYPFAIEEIS